VKYDRAPKPKTKKEIVAEKLRAIKPKPAYPIIGFTGTRKGMTDDQKEAFKAFLEAHKPEEFHHGDCVGADADAHKIAKKLKIKIVIHPPEDGKHRAFCKGGKILKPKPYLERNHDIVGVCSVLIACPKQKREIRRSGTWATVRYARKMNKALSIMFPVAELKPKLGLKARMRIRYRKRWTNS